MKELQKQLQLISESLAVLAGQVESVAKYIENTQNTQNTQTAEAKEAAPVEQPKKKAPAKAAPKAKGRAAAPKKKAKAAPAKTKAAAPKAKAAAPKVEEVAKEAGKAVSVLATVFDVIKRSRKGADIAKIREKTGFESRQISNALYKLSKKGQIKSLARGVYAKA